MERLFISYARHDVDAVRTLARDVRDFEYDVWFDQEIAGGQRWWDDILRRIRECDVFLFAVTQESLNSEACMAEFNYAFALGKPVLPVVMADNVRASHLPSRLGAIQFINCAHQDKEACKSLIKAIRHLPRPGDLPSPLPEPPSVPVSYFVPLREQICSREQLSLDQQSQIVMKLRWRFDQGVGQERPEEGAEVAEEVRELLHLLLRRDDLFSKAADDARALLERISPAKPAADARPAEPVAEPRPASAPSPAKPATISAVPGPHEYEVFEHPSGGFELVKRGWSWPGFLLTWIWALAKSLWKQAIAGGAVALLAIALSDAEETAAIATLLGLGLAIVFGARGNLWLRQRLIVAGYEPKTTIGATSIDLARVLYLQRAR